KSMEWMGQKKPFNLNLSFDSLFSLKQTLTLAESMEPSQPYWLKNPQEDAFHYSIPENELIGLPETPPSLVCHLDFKVLDQDIALTLPLSYKTLDPVWGDKLEPLRLTPDFSLHFRQDVLWFHPQ